MLSAECSPASAPASSVAPFPAASFSKPLAASCWAFVPPATITDAAIAASVRISAPSWTVSTVACALATSVAPTSAAASARAVAPAISWSSWACNRSTCCCLEEINCCSESFVWSSAIFECSISMS